MDFTIAGISIIALIVGLVELAKRIGLPVRFAPLISLVFGLLFAFLSSGLSVESLVAGIVLGLAASGIWDVGKRSVLGK